LFFLLVILILIVLVIAIPKSGKNVSRGIHPVFASSFSLRIFTVFA
jgi:hypothetical protein